MDAKGFGHAALSDLARRVADARSAALDGRISSTDFATIMAISSRAVSEVFDDSTLRTDVIASLEIAMLACPLNLLELLQAPPDVFKEALRGILANIDHSTGRFRRGFLVPFSR